MCVQDRGFGGNLQHRNHRRSSTPPRFSTTPTTPATQHSRHGRCMVAFQHSCVCVRIACVGRLWSSFGGIYSENAWFPFLFLKESGKQGRGTKSPALAMGREETGGYMCPVLRCCVLHSDPSLLWTPVLFGSSTSQNTSSHVPSQPQPANAKFPGASKPQTEF